MAGLYKDPQGEKVFEKTNSRSGDIGNSKAITNSADTEYLRKRIRELESMVAKQQVFLYREYRNPLEQLQSAYNKLLRAWAEQLYCKL